MLRRVLRRLLKFPIYEPQPTVLQVEFRNLKTFTVPLFTIQHEGEFKVC